VGDIDSGEAFSFGDASISDGDDLLRGMGGGVSDLQCEGLTGRNPGGLTLRRSPAATTGSPASIVWSVSCSMTFNCWYWLFGKTVMSDMSPQVAITKMGGPAMGITRSNNK
jgi:hypothetical protein